MALRTPLFTEFWRHCVLNGGTQRRALPRDQNEEMKIFNFLEWDLNTLVALCHYFPLTLSNVILYMHIFRTIRWNRTLFEL